MHCIAEIRIYCFSMKMTPCRNHQEIPNRYQNFKQIPEIPKNELKKTLQNLETEAPHLVFQTGLKEKKPKWFKFI